MNEVNEGVNEVTSLVSFVNPDLDIERWDKIFIKSTSIFYYSMRYFFMVKSKKESCVKTPHLPNSTPR